MQTATVLSAAIQNPSDTGLSYPASNNTGWVVQIQYQLEAGGAAQTQIAVGGVNAISLWPTPSSTIQVTVPGCVNPVLVPCPDIIKPNA
jgi:hypothetical protein